MVGTQTQLAAPQLGGIDAFSAALRSEPLRLKPSLARQLATLLPALHRVSPVAVERSVVDIVTGPTSALD